ncbi:ABC transporter substrate-binding protein [Arthrobacter sp. CJ23]|uniref:ABC transporter substrate-binding protein n=1 Tax=Arthrobacter sp. CJ23 TaxID=2972479 RepID=UPI00215C36F4|nr:ABC transporter substrate-binding protein [Arthrobacter sp. CJ23]UVJ41310.1 ABC transporter substrate-binding protein [Arthrobacter sp. CJ23]
MIPNTSVSRRGFLGLAGGLGAAAALAGCGTSGASSTGGAVTGTSVAVLPSTAPATWNAVLTKLNGKLKNDLGFELDAQFINWSNYQQQSLLKFTAGEKFDSALQALWLNMAQLQQSGSLVELTNEVAKYKNLSATLPKKLLESNSWDGKLWGIPQVNSAARVQHFVIRQDLADSLGFSTITDFEQLERFFYAVKQKNDGTVPYGAPSNSGYLHAVPVPTGMFNARSWQSPDTIARAFSGKGMFFILAKDAAKTGSSAPEAFWDDEGVVETLHRIRKYYNDGIINADALNVDGATLTSQWMAGKFAAGWAMTDGTSSNSLNTLQKAVPKAALANIMPLSGGLSAKPNQTFQADNMVVVNSKGGNLDRAMQLQDWLSIRENHDLLTYGIEGTDWEPADGNKFKRLNDYAFPGYALSWRPSLERKSLSISPTEEKIFDWAQNFDNFTVDPFASFIPDVTPVKQQVAAMSNVITQFANPLFYGVVDVDTQLDKLKKAADGAGVAKLQEEMEKQANAYLKKHA